MTAMIVHLVRRNMSLSPRFHLSGEGGEIGRLINDDGSVVIFDVDYLIVQSPEGERRVAWGDIIAYKNPYGKYDIQGVFVCTKETELFVPMSGSYGLASRFKDAYCFIPVLNVVCRVNDRRERVAE